MTRSARLLNRCESKKMPKQIDTLVEDIYRTVLNGCSDVKATKFSIEAGAAIESILCERMTSKRKPPMLKDKVLRMSSAGRPCLRQQWYSFREKMFPPEPMRPEVLIKFMFGDMIEALVVFLSKCAGHRVTDQQKELVRELPNGWTVIGHADGKWDHEPCDVKSASTYAMNKFRSGDLGDDAFGYQAQLDLYREAFRAENASWLAVDKQHGYIVRCKSEPQDVRDDDLVNLTDALDSDEIPDRIDTGTDLQTNGNVHLRPVCSYCQYKRHCYPALRAFKYSQKVVFMPHIEKEPKVPEVDLEV